VDTVPRRKVLPIRRSNAPRVTSRRVTAYFHNTNLQAASTHRDSRQRVGHILMSSLFRDYVASVRPRGEPCRSRSMVLCLAGHHPVLSIGGNARRQGLKTTSALLCPRSPGLTPRSLFGYSIVDSLIIRPQLDPQYPSPPLTTPTLLLHLIKSPRREFGEFPSPA
jgi:hypothetical protein